MTHLDKLKKLAEKWATVSLYTGGLSVWTLTLENEGYRIFKGNTPEQAIDKAWEAEGME